MPGREIVEADDLLVRPQQDLDEVRSYEAGGPSDEPSRRIAAL
jgi:hypothetical protein